MTQGLVVGPNGQIHDVTIVILMPREPLLYGSRPFVIFQAPDESGTRLTEEVDGGEGADELGNSGGVWMVDQTADVQLGQVHRRRLPATACLRLWCSGMV